MIRVRKATKEDIETIVELWHRLMKMHEYIEYFVLASDADRHYANELNKWMDNENGLVFVAEDEGKIVGYTLGWIHNMPQVFRMKKRAYINDMWVDDNYRRKGAGTMLVDKVKQVCSDKGIDVLDMAVAANNESGICFWRSQGFNLETYRMVQYLKKA